MRLFGVAFRSRFRLPRNRLPLLPESTGTTITFRNWIIRDLKWRYRRFWYWNKYDEMLVVHDLAGIAAAAAAVGSFLTALDTAFRASPIIETPWWIPVVAAVSYVVCFIAYLLFPSDATLARREVEEKNENELRTGNDII